VIRLSNGHTLDHVVASGSLAFDGKGWPWERPMVAAGLIRPDLFAVTLKTLTRQPRAGHLRWTNPWTCIRLLPEGGAVNKVGLTNPGIEWWLRDVAPRMTFASIVSLWGEPDELAEMAAMVDALDLVGLELNASCPNTGHPQVATDATVRAVEAVHAVSRHPLIVKTSVAQDYIAIARATVGLAQAVSLNSVPWEIAFPDRRTPLRRLENRVGGGGGGVSGGPAQKLNWRAVAEIAADKTLPVIAPGIMAEADVATVRAIGASAVSYGSIHFRTPWKPTAIVRRDLASRAAA